MNAVVLVVAGEGLLVDHEVALRAAILWIGKEGGELMASRNMQALDGDHSSAHGCTPRCIAGQPHVERALLDLLIVLETWSDVDRQLLGADEIIKIIFAEQDLAASPSAAPASEAMLDDDEGDDGSWPCRLCHELT